MNRILKQVITNCGECPFMKWEPDNSESNHDGSCYCRKEHMTIVWDTKYPPIPKWCPLPKEKE